MRPNLTERVLPSAQRRTLADLTDDLDLTAGESASKKSAFWTLLLLSAVIAAAGVLSDSTATVIGAMIIAPLSTPIMGVALGVVLRDARIARQAVRYVALGGTLVVLVGVLFVLVTPGDANLFTNSQIAGRTSPGLLDLVAAVATGAAGSVALTRRDVAAVLPGVAIAISLVPPLVVVGVCLGQGSIGLALGAMVLFTSNFIALVVVGTFVFTLAGYARPRGEQGLSRRRAYTLIGTLLALVMLALSVSTLVSYLVDAWSQRVRTVAESWIASVPGARVERVDLVSGTFYVHVLTPTETPPVHELAERLHSEVPDGLSIAVSTVVGRVSDPVLVGSRSTG